MNGLAITLGLNEDQREVFSLALKKTGIQPFARNGTIEVRTDNGLQIRTAIVDFFRKKFSFKTKTSETLHACMMCERIIEKLDAVLVSLGIELPNEPLVQEDSDVVEEIPSLTAGKETPAIVESESEVEVVETIPSLTAKEPEPIVYDDEVFVHIPSLTEKPENLTERPVVEPTEEVPAEEKPAPKPKGKGKK